MVASTLGSVEDAPAANPRDPFVGNSELLRRAADAALTYVAAIEDRPVVPSGAALAALDRFDEPLPVDPRPAEETLEQLTEFGGPATMATTGARYFGFVNGGTLPVALGAALLTAAWDQNAALPVMSPVAARLHEVVRGWVTELLDLPAWTELALVTGATMANASCLAAARDHLAAAYGWDVPGDGLSGAPPVEVVVGERAHTTIGKSLAVIGLGRNRVTVVPADDQGRMTADGLAELDIPRNRPVIVCAQAGEVNTGAFDPFDEIAEWCRQRPTGTWVHIDGAFGLWAAADPTRSELVAGLNRADSWATDAHKWLNVTYDCGLALVARPGALRRTFAASAGYLPPDDGFEAMHHTPQSSQRARQIELWAALRTLGRSGVAVLVQRSCDSARAMADELGSAGFEILNDVVLNQVLVGWGDGAATEALITAIQRDGRIWCGPTTWQGRTAMRLSVSSWRTRPEEAAAAARIIIELAER